MRIHGSGIAHNGRAAIKRRRELFMASAAISCLHALLAVARGDITPEQARDFFWHGEDISAVSFFGDVLSFEDKAEAAHG